MLNTLKEKKSNKQTLAYVHYLKMIAIFAVVGIHVFGDKYYYDLPQNGIWYGVLAIGSLFRFGVPIFVMCSGALHLNEEKEFPIRKALRLAIKYAGIFILWSIIYTTADWLLFQNESNYFVYFYQNLANYKYHLWYLPTLIFLCLITPALKLLTKTENKKIVEYLLVVFTLVITICSLSSYFKGFVPLQWITTFLPTELIGYTMIYLTGWYFSVFTLSKKWTKAMVITGLCAYALSPIINCLASYILSEKTFYTTDNFNIVNYLFTCAIFLVFKNAEDKLPKNRCVRFIANNTLYAYLIHVLLIMLCQQFLLPQALLDSYWLLPILVAELFVVGIASVFVSFTLQKILRLFQKRE